MDSSEVAHKVLRVLALVVGGVASLIGVWGVVLVLGGNRYLDGGGLKAALAGVTGARDRGRSAGLVAADHGRSRHGRRDNRLPVLPVG